MSKWSVWSAVVSKFCAFALAVAFVVVAAGCAENTASPKSDEQKATAPQMQDRKGCPMACSKDCPKNCPKHAQMTAPKAGTTEVKEEGAKK